MAASSEYVCSLDAATLKKAKKELGEDPAQRLGQVDTLRTWVGQQTHLKYPTDTPALLQVLRYAKFSQLRARETIENMCTLRGEVPQWYCGLDPADDYIERFLNTGFVVELPDKTKNGERVVLLRQGVYNPEDVKKWKDDFIKGWYTCLFHWLQDEDTQVNGLVYLMDYTGLTMGHYTLFTLEENKRAMRAMQKCIPNRFKGFYVYNANSVFEVMMEMFRPLMSKKMSDRIIMMGSNMEDVYKVFPKSSLPVEYLPDDYTGPHAGTMQELSSALLARLRATAAAEHLRHVSRPEWKADKTAGRKLADVPNASFRKLNLD